MVFTTLFKSNNFFVRFLIFLKQFDISSSFVHVLIQINIWNVSSLPNINWHVGMSLDNKDKTRIQLFALVALIQVFHQESTGDLVRVLRLVTTNQEHARENWNAVHRRGIETLVELDQLCNECHVWVGDCTSLTNVFQAFI